jgi:signal transduction histidine kinase
VSTDPLALLLVDDLEENLVALEAALEPLGHRMVRAQSGEEALRHLLKDEFAAVVLDVQMPGLDGFETAEAIRGRERTGRVPIIFLTAMQRDEEQQLRGFSSGAVDYLLKPVDPHLLRAKVDVFVRLHAAELELRRQRDELERRAGDLARSNADLDQFASVVSHDLLDPVNVISGYLELLRDRLGPGLDVQSVDWLDRVSACAQRAHALVVELLGYSRLGGPESRPEPVHAMALGDALADARENLTPLLAGSGSTVEVVGSLPPVAGARNELGRVFQNLITNAVVHGYGPVHITVTAHQEGDRVVVRVRDDGAGLPIDQMERVFGLFERAGGPGPEPRTGLGLAICRRIVNRSGGHIWMEPNDGAGLSVLFTLPPAGAR